MQRLTAKPCDAIIDDVMRVVVMYSSSILDLILWRVMSMARSSNNRKSKISACELLHSITLYLIGRNAQRENAKQSLEMSPLYDKLFPALFHLACDNDQVSCAASLDRIVDASGRLAPANSRIVRRCQPGRLHSRTKKIGQSAATTATFLRSCVAQTFSRGD